MVLQQKEQEEKDLDENENRIDPHGVQGLIQGFCLAIPYQADGKQFRQQNKFNRFPVLYPLKFPFIFPEVHFSPRE